MKPFIVFLLAVSMALNATFAFLLVVDRVSAPAPAVVASTSKPVKPKAATVDEKAWEELQPAEAKGLAARLEAEGFPPAMVQAILAAQINQTFEARRKALMTAMYDGPFWTDRMRDPKGQLALRQLGREQEQAVRDALGHEPDEGASMSLYRHKNLDFLSSDKAGEVRRLIREYDERRSDMYAAGYSQMTDAEKMKTLEKDQASALAAMLTPSEFAEYNLRSSRTADSLREELSAFAPSEQEFRAIYGLRAPFDERFSQDFGISMAGDERSRAHKELTEQIKTLLGAERAAEYEKKTDYNYRRTSQLVARLELPPTTADQLWTIQKDVETQRREMYSNSAGRPSSEVTEKMKALQQQTIARITPLLGQRGIESYYQYGGSWVQSLVPRTRTPITPVGR